MVSTNQKAGLALARGFIVLIMPAVHSVWLYSADSVKEGWLGTVLAFLAEGPGAQLFMFLMGVFIVLSRPKTLKQVVIRSVTILALGYFLNFFKLVIPNLAGWFPPRFFPDNGIAVHPQLNMQLLLVGDILQFAAIAYPLCCVVLKLQQRVTVIILLILFVLAASPFVWHLSDGNFAGSHVVSLLGSRPPEAFFPVFPWLFYPLCGLLGGVAMQEARMNEGKICLLFLMSGIIMILAGRALSQYEPLAWSETFYRLGPAGTIMHGGIVLSWLAVFLMLPRIMPGNYFFRFLKWLSKNITVIYLLQWIIIMWMLPVFGYGRLNLTASLLALSITSIISFMLSLFLQKFLSTKKKKYE